MILLSIIGVILMILCISISQPILAITILVGVIIFDAYQFFINYTERQQKIKKRDERKDYSKYILLNTIAEIVDFKFICKNNRKTHDQINIFLNSLDYRNYIKGHEQNRNIQIGGNNG